MTSQSLTRTTTQEAGPLFLGNNPSPPAITAQTTAAQAASTVAGTTPLNKTVNPIAVPVYEVRNPNPQPESVPPETAVRETFPIASLLALGGLTLRREWEKGKKGERREKIPLSALPEEKTIRRIIMRVNEDLIARGLPLRLVLSQSEEGYAVEIYDCSGNVSCQVVQDILLNLQQLPTLLSNLERESGILIDTKT